MVAAVQRLAKGAVASPLTIGSVDGWATPTAGNLLVVSANSDSTVSPPSGSGTWTNGPSVVDGNGTYSWYKFATGTETTISCAPGGGAFDIVVTACEYSGVAAFDVQNSSTIAGSAGATTTAAAVTTTQAGDLILAFALVHSGGGGATLPSPAWTAGLTNVLAAYSGTNTAATCNSLAGELLNAGAAGLYSPSASWTATTSPSDRQQLTLAFKATTGPAARPARPIIARQAVGFAANW